MSKSFIVVPVFVFAAFCLAFLATDTGEWITKSAVAQEEGNQPRKVTFAKDLQVLEVNSMLELQTYMKGITEALGVTCKHCHVLTDFSITDESLHKDEGREMMRITRELNEKYFKDSEHQVTCFTCHRGHEHPAGSPEEWKKQTGAEG
ncbi:MAG: c-type cytochrome [bacterium]